MTRLPRCILLDLDGTLLDSLPGLRYSTGEAFRGEGMEVDLGGLPALIGPPIRQILDALRPGLAAAQLDRLEAGFRRSYDVDGWKKTTCFPGAQEALSEAHRSGRRLFVVSNKPRHISLCILQAEHLLDLFEEVVTRDSRQPAYRDKAEMIQALMQRRELTADSVVMVGDTMEDADAASNNGVAFLWMTHGYGHAAEDRPQPQHRCAHFRDWLPMLAEERFA